MSETMSTWDEVRRLVDELELKIHLGSMDARDRWKALVPRLHAVERSLTIAGQRASTTLDREIAAIGAALQRLRDDVSPRSGPT